MRRVPRGRSAALAGLVLVLPILGVVGWLLKDSVVEEVILRKLARTGDRKLWMSGSWLAERGSARGIPVVIRLRAKGGMGEHLEDWDFIVGIVKRERSQAVAALARLLTDEEEAVRCQAAQILDWLGPHGMAPQRALKTALGDPSARIRDLAASILIEQRAGTEECLEVLLHTLRDPASEDHRALVAAELVGQLVKAGAPALPDLIRILESGKDPHGFIASKSLLQIGEPAVSSLLQLLDRGGSLTSSAALILGELGREEAIPHLVAALHSEIDEIRRDAVCTLGSLGPRASAAISPLEDIQCEKGKLAFLATCALAVMDPGHHPPVPRLLKRAIDPEDDAHPDAVAALQRMGFDASLIGPVIEALRSDEWVIRRAAIRILGGARGDTSRAREALRDATKDWDPLIRRAARESLAALDRHAARLARGSGVGR